MVLLLLIYCYDLVTLSLYPLGIHNYPNIIVHGCRVEESLCPVLLVLCYDLVNSVHLELTQLPGGNLNFLQ